MSDVENVERLGAGSVEDVVGMALHNDHPHAGYVGDDPAFWNSESWRAAARMAASTLRSTIASVVAG